jgi:hypothetical protein
MNIINGLTQILNQSAPRILQNDGNSIDEIISQAAKQTGAIVSENFQHVEEKAHPLALKL